MTLSNFKLKLHFLQNADLDIVSYKQQHQIVMHASVYVAGKDTIVTKIWFIAVSFSFHALTLQVFHFLETPWLS